MKIESRGKYPGVKVHLDEEECNAILAGTADNPSTGLMTHEAKLILPLICKLGIKMRQLVKAEPEVLAPRTPEQIKAILAKEVEKAKIQLDTLNQTGQFKEINQSALKKALLKHVEA